MVIKTNGSQKESKVLDIGKKPNHLLHYDVEYDTTQPGKTIQKFVEDVKNMISRFEGNKERVAQIDTEIIDLEHYMEIGKFKNVPDGYKLYRRLAELRRERRACKNENDLLQPVYEYFHATEVLGKLSRVQGECAKVQNTIDGRMYTVRTDILDDFLCPEKKETTITIEFNVDSSPDFQESLDASLKIKDERRALDDIILAGPGIG